MNQSGSIGAILKVDGSMDDAHAFYVEKARSAGYQEGYEQANGGSENVPGSKRMVKLLPAIPGKRKMVRCLVISGSCKGADYILTHNFLLECCFYSLLPGLKRTC